MNIKLVLSTGKEIELTEEEYEEIKGQELKQVFVPFQRPWYPSHPPWENPWTNPQVTYTTTNCTAEKRVE